MLKWKIYNMDIARIMNPTESDYERVEKYKRSYNKLQKKRGTLC